MEISKNLMVTGHRDVPADKIAYVKQELRKEISQAIEDGFTNFLTGMAEGVDLYFAEIVAEFKRDNPSITMEAAIPYRKRLEAKDPLFQTLIKQCDKIMVQCEEYQKSCFMDRNKYMTNNSERVIAVFDGREGGGTYATIKYARKMNRDTHVISIKR